MTEKREKRLSERNDDSKMESFMFEKMEQLEANVAGSKI